MAENRALEVFMVLNLILIKLYYAKYCYKYMSNIGFIKFLFMFFKIINDRLCTM